MWASGISWAADGRLLKVPQMTLPGSPISTVLTVREATWALMRAHGMTTVFGNPGSTELGLFLHWPDDFRYVLGLQEAVVVGMADGYAQASGNASFVNLHSAAGVGHAMGNIFTAFKNRTPMVITAGQQARSILPFDPFLHSAQATELPKPYVKWSVEPARAQDVPLAIARAYHVAMTPPRGPVLVSVPADDWAVLTEPVLPHRVSTHLRPEPALLAELAAQLEHSQRPAIVVGAAVDRDGAVPQAVALAERHRARVWVAPMSGRCSFPEDHPLFAGFLPATRERIVELLAGHDLILALGAPAFTYHVEGAGPHVPAGAQLIQITDDPQTAAWAPLGLSLIGSLKLSLLDLLAHPASAVAAARAPAAPRAPVPRVPLVPRPPTGQRMPAAFLMQTLSELRGRASVVVEEAPSTRPVMQRHLPFFAGGTFYTMCSGGLGHSLPAAVGVALARPQDKVIALMGDGSALYAIQALWSLAQLQLPVTVIIVNNRRYAALHHFAPVFGFVPGAALPGTDLPGLDFVALAAGHGVKGMRVQDPAKLRAVLEEALAAPGPVLVDVEVE